MQTNSGVYKIICYASGAFYIGASTNLKHRERCHFSMLAHRAHHSKKLQDAYNQFGRQNFGFEVISLVSDKLELFEREKFIIALFSAEKNICNKIKPLAGVKVKKVRVRPKRYSDKTLINHIRSI